jgi:hypothetical protein
MNRTLLSDFAKLIQTIRRPVGPYVATVLRPKRIAGSAAARFDQAMQLAATRCSADLCLPNACPYAFEGLYICSSFM